MKNNDVIIQCVYSQEESVKKILLDSFKNFLKVQLAIQVKKDV